MTKEYKFSTYKEFVKNTQLLFLEAIWQKKMKREGDAFILLEQDKGAGKSTLAITLASRWYALLRDKGVLKGKLRLKRNIIYDDDLPSILDRIKSIPPYSPLIFDEGGRIILAEDWNRKENKAIKKLFAEIRTKHLLVIINSPFAIEQIDKKYLTNFIDYWVHLWGKGIATIFRKNLNPLNKGFALEILKRILPEYIPEITSLREYVKQLRPYLIRHPCYFGELFWTKIDDQLYKKYQILRDEAVYGSGEDKEIESVNMKVRIHKARLMYYLRYAVGLSPIKVGELLGINERGVQSYIHRHKEYLQDLIEQYAPKKKEEVKKENENEPDYLL